jgi:hypothetical protein
MTLSTLPYHTRADGSAHGNALHSLHGNVTTPGNVGSDPAAIRTTLQRPGIAVPTQLPPTGSSTRCCSCALPAVDAAPMPAANPSTYSATPSSWQQHTLLFRLTTSCRHCTNASHKLQHMFSYSVQLAAARAAVPAHYQLQALHQCQPQTAAAAASYPASCRLLCPAAGGAAGVCCHPCSSASIHHTCKQQQQQVTKNERSCVQLQVVLQVSAAVGAPVPAATVPASSSSSSSSSSSRLHGWRQLCPAAGGAASVCCHPCSSASIHHTCIQQQQQQQQQVR